VTLRLLRVTIDATVDPFEGTDDEYAVHGFTALIRGNSISSFRSVRKCGADYRRRGDISPRASGWDHKDQLRCIISVHDLPHF
jgi:hypothetical protein